MIGYCNVITVNASDGSTFLVFYRSVFHSSNKIIFITTQTFSFQTCKSYANELVDRCLDHCQEWLLPLPQGSSLQKDKLEVDETRRLAAAHLSKELALATPSAFFLRVNLFFRYIFHGIRDNRPTVRIAAIDALHIVFVIVSQREMKHRTEWFKVSKIIISVTN